MHTLILHYGGYLSIRYFYRKYSGQMDVGRRTHHPSNYESAIDTNNKEQPLDFEDFSSNQKINESNTEYQSTI